VKFYFYVVKKKGKKKVGNRKNVRKGEREARKRVM
jgi:hypothetical protein